MAENVNFNIIQGDTFVLNATYKDPQGNLIDLYGYEIVFQVRDAFGGKVICATVTNNDGITLDPVTKAIRVQIDPEQTNRFTVPKSVYQFQITSPNQQKITLATGYFSVEKAAIV